MIEFLRYLASKMSKFCQFQNIFPYSRFTLVFYSSRDAKDAELKSLRKTAEKLREEVEHLRKQLTSEKYER